MKFTRIVEETVSGTSSVEEYRIRMDEEYPTLDIASDEFSIVAAGAINILQHHITIANYWIGWIKSLEKTYSSTDSLSSFTTIANTPNFSGESLHQCKEYPKAHTGIGLVTSNPYRVTADIPIKGTVGFITENDGEMVNLFIPIADNKGVRFRLKKDQVSRVDDKDYCRVMIDGKLITRTDDVRKKMESTGIATTIINRT